MPRLITMGTLVTRCKNRADKANSDHVSEWKELIHEVYGADIYNVVAETAGRYFETLATLTTSGAAYVSEPADHLSTVRVDYVASSTDRRQLHRIMPGEEAKLAGLTGGEPIYYSLIDDRIYLWPTPPTGKTIEMRYIPQSPDISAYADATNVDVINAAGEACLIWTVAALARAKAAQDVTLHLAMAEKYKAELRNWAAERSIGDANRRTVTDIDPLFDGYDAGDWRTSR
jgi:hypothetical protein